MKAEWRELTLPVPVHQLTKQKQDEDNMTNPFRDPDAKYKYDLLVQKNA
jgi:hypothetical protein